ncbi:uncharacterized protein LOC144448724 [Glandiceps talaboti]
MAAQTFQEAKQHLNDQYSCFELITTRKHMALSPSYLGKLRSGVNEQLMTDLRLYSDSLKGALVAYDNVKLVQPCGELIDDQPYIHFDIQLDMIVFRPTVGSILRAVVHKIAPDHIGCLIHGCFNAAVRKSKKFINGCSSADLTMGQEFILKVIRLDSEKGILSIKGVIENTLLPSEVTGSRKRSESKDNTMTSQDKTDDVGCMNDSLGEPSRKKKRKKDKKEKGDAMEKELNKSVELEETKEQKKKKKHRKEKSESDSLQMLNAGVDKINSNEFGSELNKSVELQETKERKKKNKKHRKEKSESDSSKMFNSVVDKVNGNEFGSESKKKRKTGHDISMESPDISIKSHDISMKSHDVSMKSCDDSECAKDGTPKRKKGKRKSKELSNTETEIADQSFVGLVSEELSGDSVEITKKHKKSKKSKRK